MFQQRIAGDDANMRFMRRIVLAGVLLFSFISSAQTREQDAIDWGSPARQVWNEKSLREYSTKDEVYRALLSTPFWGQAMSRVVIGADGTVKLVTKVRNSSQGENLVSDSRPLSDAEVEKFRALLNQARFWALFTKEAGPRRYKDSDTCTLEAVEHGNYHAVRREIGPRSAFGDVCQLFARQALKHTHSQIR